MTIKRQAKGWLMELLRKNHIGFMGCRGYGFQILSFCSLSYISNISNSFKVKHLCYMKCNLESYFIFHAM